MSFASYGSYSSLGDADEDVGFSPPPAGGPPVPADGVVRAAHPFSVILKRMEEEVADLADKLAVDADTSLALLCGCEFDASKILADWFAEEETSRRHPRVLAGVRAGADPPPLPPGTTPADVFTCPVTLSDCTYGEATALPCGHYASCDAWRDHLRSALASVRTNRTAVSGLLCIDAPGCREMVRGRVWRTLLEPAEKQDYENALLQAYVLGHRGLHACKTADCSWVLEGEGHTTSCPLGHTHCAKCDAAASGGHRPATCVEASQWKKLDANEGSLLEWLADPKNKARACPSCFTPLERIEGCNKVICRAPGCGVAFCFVCGGFPYTKFHAYPAGAFSCTIQPASDVSKDVYTGYYSRFMRTAESASLFDKAAPMYTDIVWLFEACLGSTAQENALLGDAVAAVFRA